MNAKDFTKLLIDLSACREAREWAEEKDFTTVWNTCERADWLLWLCGKMVGQPNWPTRQELVLAACACARTVLEKYEAKFPNDNRARLALEKAESWATTGKTTLSEVQAAAADAAADAAYAAAYAADATAYAAYAAAYAAYAAYAADAADATAYAAYAADAADAADATAYAARKTKLKELADLVRNMLTPTP